MVTAIVCTSVVLQVTAAALALRLIRVTGGLKAWILISCALVLMALRRAVPLSNLLQGEDVTWGELPFEAVGAVISALMVAGVAAITPLFRTLQRSRDALRESEERYHRLFDSGNDAVLVYPVDAAGRAGTFSEVNDVACRTFGYDRQTLLKLSPTNLLGPGGEQVSAGAMSALLAEKRSLYEASYRTRSGEAVPVEVSSRLFDFKGRPTVLSVVRDVTERRRAEDERESLIRELQEALTRVKALSGLVPICASCKRIRDEKGAWNPLEAYIEGHSNAEFTHGLCPECARELYPGHCDK